jgi:hypothetical protein
MNLKTNLAVALISLASCLTGAAKAMSIHDFGKMNNDDEATYVALLVEGSAEMLRAHGQPEQARKVIAFFKESGKDGGVQQFASNLKMVDALNKRNSINPNNRAPVYQVEDAMELTLKDDGIIVPASYLLTINKDFRPSGPSRPRTIGQ